MDVQRSAESIQRRQWMDSWLQYVQACLPMDSPFRHRACEAAQQLLQDLDQQDFNSIVRQALNEVMEQALAHQGKSIPLTTLIAPARPFSAP